MEEKRRINTVISDDEESYDFGQKGDRHARVNKNGRTYYEYVVPPRAKATYESVQQHKVIEPSHAHHSSDQCVQQPHVIANHESVIFHDCVKLPNVIKSEPDMINLHGEKATDSDSDMTEDGAESDSLHADIFCDSVFGGNIDAPSDRIEYDDNDFCWYNHMSYHRRATLADDGDSSSSDSDSRQQSSFKKHRGLESSTSTLLDAPHQPSASHDPLPVIVSGGDKSFVCDVCHQGYKRHTGAWRHMIMQHGRRFKRNHPSEPLTGADLAAAILRVQLQHKSSAERAAYWAREIAAGRSGPPVPRGRRVGDGARGQMDALASTKSSAPDPVPFPRPGAGRRQEPGQAGGVVGISLPTEPLLCSGGAVGISLPTEPPLSSEPPQAHQPSGRRAESPRPYASPSDISEVLGDLLSEGEGFSGYIGIDRAEDSFEELLQPDVDQGEWEFQFPDELTATARSSEAASAVGARPVTVDAECQVTPPYVPPPPRIDRDVQAVVETRSVALEPEPLSLLPEGVSMADIARVVRENKDMGSEQAVFYFARSGVVMDAWQAQTVQALAAQAIVSLRDFAKQVERTLYGWEPTMAYKRAQSAVANAVGRNRVGEDYTNEHRRWLGMDGPIVMAMEPSQREEYERWCAVRVRQCEAMAEEQQAEELARRRNFEFRFLTEQEQQERIREANRREAQRLAEEIQRVKERREELERRMAAAAAERGGGGVPPIPRPSTSGSSAVPLGRGQRPSEPSGPVPTPGATAAAAGAASDMIDLSDSDTD